LSYNRPASSLYRWPGILLLIADINRLMGHVMKNIHLNQPIGEALPDWRARPLPSRDSMIGSYCQLESLDPARHAKALFAAYSDEGGWTYLPYGPFADLDEFTAWLKTLSQSDDPLFFTLIKAKSETPLGLASYLRIEPKVGVIEIGHIHLAPALQKSTAATEAIFLLMRRAFDELGYRRFEWKCDALNEPSRKAALRYGFIFEGIFRQATIYKGRNRDTAWYSITDQEWPEIKSRFEAWLNPANFTPDGRQVKSLAISPPGG
jgi:RimJ/RimL family protein N-acetyltransferase